MEQLNIALDTHRPGPLTVQPGVYIHGFSLSQNQPSAELATAGQMWSPQLRAVLDFGKVCNQVNIREHHLTSIQPDQGFIGEITYRAQGILQRSLNVWNHEMDFENLRRKIAPDKASRLACIWVAEDSSYGRNLLGTMLQHSFFIARVAVASFRFTKADVSWFESYCLEEQDPDFIKKYWSGEESACPRWEFLLEGMIQMIEPKEVEHLQKYGGHKITDSDSPSYSGHKRLLA